MIKTHKIALVPRKAQATQLSKHSGYARVAYNHALNAFKDALDKGDWKSLYDLKRAFNAVKKDEYEWNGELSQNASKNAIHDLGRAIENWKDKALPAKFPRRRKRSRKQSYRADNGKGTVKVVDKSVYLPKIGWLKMSERLRFEGELGMVTVIKTHGRWFVCLSVDDGKELPAKRDGDTIGIDMGLTTLAVYSDGTEVHNPDKAIARAFRKLRRVDKAIARSRKVHGKDVKSNRRFVLYDKRARLYGRIQCLRDDIHHKATSALVSATTVGKVIVETLNIAGMRRNKRLSRSFHRAGISGFLRMLEYKCEWHGIAFEKVDRWFPSTKKCSACGHCKSTMLLSEREYVCTACGFVIDRDLNAAKNLAQYDAASSAESLNGRGGAVRRTRGNTCVDARPTKRLFSIS